MRFARFLPVLMIVTVAGCGQFKGSGSDTPLISSPKPPISDVPIPAGFSMTKASTSKVVAASGLRIVDHYYDGDDSYLPVAAFYKEQMPKYGWILLDQTQPGGGKEVRLHFSNAKTNEDCSVNVQGKAFNTEIHVRIDPAGNAGTTAK